MAREENLYIAFSTYHLMIATSLAVVSESESTLIVSRYNQKCQERVQRLRELQDSPFEHVIFVEGDYEKADVSPYRGLLKQNKNSLFFLNKRSIKKLEKINLTRPDKIYSFNDSSALTQYVFTKFSNSDKTVIEEGLGDYKQKPEIGIKDKLKENLVKLYLGSWYQHVNCNGGYDKTDEVKAFMPRKHCSGNARKMDENIFSDLSNSGLKEAFNLPQFEQEYCVVIAPLSEILDEEDKRKFVRKVDKKVGGLEVHVKYHPRETEQYLRDGLKQANQLPTDLPAELIFLSCLENEPEKVIGLNSTALYSASNIFDKSQIFALMGSFKGFSNYSGFFKQSKITLS